MSVCYKKLQHMLIEREISHSQLMREAHISANIISKIKTGQYIALDKVESICNALNCTPNDILVFLPDNPDNNSNNNKGAKGKNIVIEIDNFDVIKDKEIQGCIIRCSNDEGNYIVGCRMPEDSNEIKDYVNKNYSE